VLRQAGDLSLRLPCIIRPTYYVRCQFHPWDSLVWVYLSTLACQSFIGSHYLISSVVPWEISILTNIIIIIYLLYYFTFSNWIKWLRFGLQCLVCADHIKLWILFCFIILLFSWFIRDLNMFKGFLLWSQVGTEKVRSSHLAPRWVERVFIFYYLSLSSFMDSYLFSLNMIIEVVSYPFILFYCGEVDYYIQKISEYVLSSRSLS
jgi:hypothetical protein